MVFIRIKIGRACNFPQMAPLIVPEQKVTVGALNAVVRAVVKYFRMLLGTKGVCTCKCSDAQVSRDQSMRV